MTRAVGAEFVVMTHDGIAVAADDPRARSLINYNMIYCFYVLLSMSNCVS